MTPYNKAIAGGVAAPIAGQVSDVVMYFLQQVPVIAHMPPGLLTTVGYLVTAGIAAAGVYLAPANKPIS